MSSTPYNPPQWTPYPNNEPINAEFTHTASMATSIGDLLWFDATSNTLKPVSQIPDQGTAALTQGMAASLFAGVSNSAQLSTDATARQARVLVDVLVEFAVGSNTFNPGDYVTFNYTNQGALLTGALADQSLVKTSNPALAIGRVVKQYTSSSTVCKVRLTSRLFAGFLGDQVFSSGNAGNPGNPNSANGSTASDTGGAGYVATTGTAGNGGAATQVGGVGGAATTGTGGTGGAGSVTGGAGGAVTTGTAGVGGASSTIGGVGGASTGTATAGGVGGAGNLKGGAGGATSGTGNSPGGAGGVVAIAGGAGGNAAAGTGNGGAGGAVTINGGAGGTSSGGAAGAVGTVTVQSGVAIPAGGSASGSLLLSSTAAFGIYFGSGAPTVSAAQGSLYLRSDGSSTSTRAYINTTGSTTWTNITTAA